MEISTKAKKKTKDSSFYYFNVVRCKKKINKSFNNLKYMFLENSMAVLTPS